MTAGIAALAVPGSALFASEFLVLLGAFRDWWLIGALASARDRARGDVHAALDLGASCTTRPPIRRRGSSRMGDLRWEAAYLLPLVACVLALSVYPYAVTHRVSDSMHGIVSAVTAKAGPVIAAAAAIATPSVQLGAILPAFLLTVGALAPALVGSFESTSARVTSGVIGLAELRRRGPRAPGTSGTTATARPSAASSRPTATRRSCRRSCARAAWPRSCSAGARAASATASPSTTRCSASPARACACSPSANGFVSLFVALELFSISLYVLCALDVHDAASLESGLKYLVIGSVGSAALLFGSGLDLHRHGLAALRPDRQGGRQPAARTPASSCSASR